MKKGRAEMHVLQTVVKVSDLECHCEERSDVAIRIP